MRNNNKYVSVLALISMTMGTFSWGQGPGGRPGQGGFGGQDRGWGGPSSQHFGGQNGIPRIGSPVFNTGCGQQYQQANQAALLQACVNGGAAGLQTAQSYATQQGRSDGFRTGYAWGMRQAIDANSTDQNQKAAGAAALNPRDFPQAIEALAKADLAGSTAGAAAGKLDGDQEAVSRFHNAIDTGSTPSSVVVPTDYANHNPSYSSNYGDPYGQTVGAQQTEDSLLRSGQIDPGNVTFYGNGYNGRMLGQQGSQQFRPGDLYSRDGRYDYNNNRNSCLNGQQAFNILMDNSRGFNRSSYPQQATVQILVGYTTAPLAPIVTAPVTAAPGPVVSAPVAPIGNPSGGNGQGGQQHAGGQGGGQGGPGGQRPGQPAAPTAPVVQAPAPVVTAPAVTAPVAFVPQPIYQTYNIQDIYKQAFVNSYEKVAGYYYNEAYNNMLDDGTNAGEYVGQQIGQRLAYQSGLVNAYNATFRARELDTFKNGIQTVNPAVPGYDSAFKTQFGKEFTFYSTNPVIGVDAFSIAPTGPRAADGIVEPGEGIAASFVVRNYGGVPATLPVTLEGDITGASSASLVVPQLRTVTQAGTLTASISSSIASQSNADVTLNVNGSRIPLAQYVTRQVVSTAPQYSADFANGKVTVSMALQNVSRVDSYDAVTLTITDSLGRTQSLPMIVKANQTWNPSVNLTGFDQLSMIDGNVSVKVQAMLGSVQIGSGTLVVSTTDKYNQLAAAFEIIAQGTDANKQAAMLSRLMNDIQGEAENASGGQYDDSHGPFLIAALVNAKATHAQTATTIAAYNSLAVSLKGPEGHWSWKKRAIHLWGRSENQIWFEKQINALRQ
jgi:hypothetical protein